MLSRSIAALIATLLLFGCATTQVNQNGHDGTEVTAGMTRTWPALRNDLIHALRADPHVSIQTLEDGSLYILLRSTDSFESGSSDPSATLRTILDHIGAVLEPHQDALSVHVVGHTDNIGSAEHNLALSDARATSVAEYLRRHGLEGAELSAEGKGLNEPLASNQNREGRAVNRRIELLVDYLPWEATDAEQSDLDGS